MTKTAFQEYIKPIVVLVVICLVVSFLLAFTNSVTAPIIEENARQEAIRTRQEVLPGSASFTELDVSGIEGIESAFREDGGLGYVVSAGYKGYGGIVTVTVGLDNAGKIVGISANVSSETKGIGSKAGQESYLSNYKDLVNAAAAEQVDTISNATYSSTAVRDGVSAILKNFESIKGAAQK